MSVNVLTPKSASFARKTTRGTPARRAAAPDDSLPSWQHQFVAAPFVEIAVRGTAPGIPPEERERIFEAFEQLGDASRSGSMRHGTRLSLTVARQLAALLRGELRLESGAEGGSVFRLRIPARYGEEREPAPAALEEEFDLSIPSEVAFELRSVRQVVDSLEALLQRRAADPAAPPP